MVLSNWWDYRWYSRLSRFSIVKIHYSVMKINYKSYFLSHIAKSWTWKLKMCPDQLPASGVPRPFFTNALSLILYNTLLGLQPRYIVDSSQEYSSLSPPKHFTTITIKSLILSTNISWFFCFVLLSFIYFHS